MADEELKNKLATIEKELAAIKKALAAEAPPRAIRVPTIVPQERLDELERQLERQNALIEVLREILSGFGPRFDKLCSDKEKKTLNPTVPDVEEAVWGKDVL